VAGRFFLSDSPLILLSLVDRRGSALGFESLGFAAATTLTSSSDSCEVIGVVADSIDCAPEKIGDAVESGVAVSDSNDNRFD